MDREPVQAMKERGDMIKFGATTVNKLAERFSNT